MSEKIDQFCDQLRDRLNAIDERLQNFKERVDTANAETEAAIRAKLDEAKADLSKHKQEAEAAGERIGVARFVILGAAL